MFGTVISADRPISSIFKIFVVWKALLLLISALASVAPDYDTSTSLFFRLQVDNDTRLPAAPSLAQRLTRWDAIYYIKSAQDGYTYEQEWAFGPGMPSVVSGLRGNCPEWLINMAGPSLEPFLAIAVSHFSHLMAVLAFFNLTIRLSNDERFAMVASLLHIISPSGLFLSAPYAEAPFTCLIYLGNLLFASSYDNGVGGDLQLVGAGVVFGSSIAFRSNGLLSGMLFASEALRALSMVVDGIGSIKFHRLGAAVTGGIWLGSYFVKPQIEAWKQYCSGQVLRPWCERTIPSIYSFVQEHYWNVGFLRYWTLDQLPLFLLATPMLSILIISGIKTARDPSCSVSLPSSPLKEQHQLFVRTLAVMQTVLATLAITNYHVQIITRISSAYPVWYWYIASLLSKKSSATSGSVIVIFMMMYAGIQGGLYSSFLPPA